MKGTIINIEQELEQLQNDERLINRYLLEKYPQISNYRLRSIERFCKIGAILAQSLIVIIQMDNNFCSNGEQQNKESQTNNQNSPFLSFITSCSQQKTFNLSIISSILLMIIGFWLILIKYIKRKFFHKIGIQAAFLVIIMLTQAITFEIYIFSIVSYFWSFILSIQLVLIIDQYIKQLKLGLFGQIATVLYLQIRFYMQYSVNPWQFIVGLLLFTILILQTFSNKVLYRNKIQILQMTRNQLNSVRQFYNDLLALIPQGLTLLDSNQNIIYANSRVTEILQCKEEEIFSILMNLSNNNAQKQSTLFDQDMQTRQTRQISASIKNGQIEINQQIVQQVENSQQSNSIKIQTQVSKQFNSYQLDENQQTNSSRSVHVINPTPINIQINQQMRNKIIQNIEDQNQHQQPKKLTTQVSFQNYKFKDQNSVKEEQTNESISFSIQQVNSIIQSDSQVSDKEFKQEIVEENKNYINNSTSKFPNSKQTQYAQSKFGTNFYKSQQKNEQLEIQDDHQYTLGADETSYVNKEVTFGKDSSKFNHQDPNLKDQIYNKKISIDKQDSFNSLKSRQKLKNTKSIQSQSDQNKAEEINQTQRENLSKQTTMSLFQASPQNQYYQIDYLPRDDLDQSSQVFDKSAGDKSGYCDISTLPFQTTERKCLYVNLEDNIELDQQIIKEQISKDNEQDYGTKTEASNLQNNYQTQNTQNTNDDYKLESSVKSQQQNQGKETPKQFSFQSSHQVNNSTNLQIQLQNQISNSNYALGAFNSAAFPSIYNVEDAKSQDPELQKQNEYYSLNQDILSFKSLDFRQDIEFLKKQKQNINFSDTERLKQYKADINEQLSEQELVVLQQQNLLLQKEIFKKRQFDSNEKDADCQTECRKQIQERSVNKRQSRLEKAVKTLEVQDLPKYNEEKQSSYFKQTEENKTNIQQMPILQKNGSQSPKKLKEKENSKKEKNLNQLPLSKQNKEKNTNNYQTISKSQTSHNVSQNQKQHLDSLVSQFNRPKGESNNSGQFNPIDGENMTLKKYVISQKESNDSAYKSIFQPKIIKKETKVKNILSKLLTLNKPDQREPDTHSEISQRTKQISQMEQENFSKNQFSNNVLKVQEAEEQDIASCMTRLKQDQLLSLDIPQQLPRSKTEYNFKNKYDNQSNIDNASPNQNNSNNNIVADSQQNKQDQQLNFLQIANPNKNSHYKKAKSPTIGGNLSFSKSFLPSLKHKNQNQQETKQSVNRNKGRKESFFNQFNKEANIGNVFIQQTLQQI